MTCATDRMESVNAYAAPGTYRGAAAVCGTTHKTVKPVPERRARGQVGRRRPRPSNTARVQPLLEERVRQTDGRISAKPPLPVARAAGDRRSSRNLQPAVKLAGAARKQTRRAYRPWVPTPGEHPVVDRAGARGREISRAVPARSRYRFVPPATDQTRVTTPRLPAERFGEPDGVPGVVLTDRMGCLKAGTVANVVVPHPEDAQVAPRYRFRPDVRAAADPESKGVVEAPVGDARRDPVVPAMAEGGRVDLSAANTAARARCAEVNRQVHSEIAAVPAERPVTERGVPRRRPSPRPPLREGEPRTVDRTRMVRFGPARYAVPSEPVGQVVQVRAEDGAAIIRQHGTDGDAEATPHRTVGPGEVALGPFADLTRRPTRGVRPRPAVEPAFPGPGGAAEAFLRAAAAAGTLRPEAEPAGIVVLEAARGREALLRALQRATTSRRFTAADVRAILAAGPGVPEPTPAGPPLPLELPAVAEHPSSAYALTQPAPPTISPAEHAVGGARGAVGGRA